MKHKTKNQKQNLGFTLIEMVVVIGVIAFTLPVLFAIVFTIVQQQVKIYRLSEVKRQGDYVLTMTSNIVKNFAYKIYSEEAMSNEQCSTTGSSYNDSVNFYIKDKLDNAKWFHFYKVEDVNNITHVASASSIVSELFLTTNKVRIYNFSLSCSRSSTYSTPLVSLSFDICYNTGTNCSSTRPEETASLTYQTKIKMKNY